MACLKIISLLIFGMLVCCKTQNTIQKLPSPKILTDFDAISEVLPDSYRNLSGLTFVNNYWYLVDDDKSLVSRYPKGNPLKTESFGIVKLEEQMEGICFCKDSFYIIVEGAKSNGNSNKVFKLNESLSRLNTLMTIDAWGENAGLEGIAIDCDKNILFLAREWGPSAVYILNLATKDTTRIDFKFKLNKEFDDDYEDDISDLFFHQDHLYLLRRKRRLIQKIKIRKEVNNKYSGLLVDSVSYESRYDFGKKERVEGKDVGLAEALYISEEYIYIGLDVGYQNKTDPLFKTSRILAFDKPDQF